MHTSIKLECPIEFINITEVNPLISRCQIKVCYVGQEPNRNGSVITKDVAREMAKGLRGAPIVGYFNPDTEDFEQHNREIEINGNEIKFIDATRPYGFVDLNAKIWFQHFLDDGVNEREYLVTEGWLWTSQYPECQRAIDSGNNQSMELDESSLSGSWANDIKNNSSFFIISEAIISKLCILGEDYEPCFEGAQITKPTTTFSFDEGFKNELFSMMKDIKQYLEEKGGTQSVFTTYAVEIGDKLWCALYDFLLEKFPSEQCEYCSEYGIEGIYEDGEQKFAVLTKGNQFFKLNFSYTEEGFATSGVLEEVTKTFVPAATPQFNPDEVRAFAEIKKAKKAKKPKEKEEEEEAKPEKEEDKSDKEDKSEKEEPSEKKEEEKVCPECGKPLSECECDKDKKDKYDLNEIQEYMELVDKYNKLTADYNALLETVEGLKDFKLKAERKEKQKMIDEEFYMLSDEDKADVISNIDTYSLSEIEAKLAVICVRNKVSFAQQEEEKGSVVYSIDSTLQNDNTPEWVKAMRSVAQNM